MNAKRFATQVWFSENTAVLFLDYFWLIELILSQNHLLQIFKDIDSLVLDWNFFLSKLFSWSFIFLHQKLPLLLLRGERRGKVHPVRIFMALRLRDSFIDLSLGNWVGIGENFLQVKVLTHELETFEIVDKVQELHFVLELNLYHLFLYAFYNSQGYQNYCHFFLAKHKIPHLLDKLHRKVVQEKTNEPLK